MSQKARSRAKGCVQVTYVAAKGQQTDPEGSGQSCGQKGGGDDEGGGADKDQPLELMTTGASCGAEPWQSYPGAGGVWFRAVNLLAYQWQRPTDPATLVPYRA